MSRMSQVMQIGDIQGDIQYYIEDYAYTYLKKQKGREKTKYFLYGEKEEKDKKKKLYIYGIAEKPKMEQSYFKDYYPLGFLKIKNDETFWITLKGQEEKMEGFYVFYAPNQAMQEYLVDHREEEKEDKPLEAKRQLVGESLPIKETLVSAGKIKRYKGQAEFKNEKFILPVGGIVIASLMLLVLTTPNGQKKIEIFKQVINQTMEGKIKETAGDNLIIEEKSAVHTSEEVDANKKEDDTKQEAVITGVAENSIEQKETIVEETVMEEPVVQEVEKEETKVSDKKEYEEYMVKEGDTLAAICKTKYGSLVQLEEICTINNIKNADYIAPGQKIYLP